MALNDFEMPAGMVMDEATAIVLVIRKIRGKITPEVIAKADATIEEWFGEPASVMV